MAKRAQSDPQFEIAFYEKVLQHSPNFVEALMALGDLYTRRGFYEKGLCIDEKLASLRPEDAVVFYNLACSYSLMNEITSAITAMQKAIALGYDEFDQLQRDPDLINLLGDDGFQAYFEKISKKGRGAKREGETV